MNSDPTHDLHRPAGLAGVSSGLLRVGVFLQRERGHAHVEGGSWAKRWRSIVGFRGVSHQVIWPLGAEAEANDLGPILGVELAARNRQLSYNHQEPDGQGHHSIEERQGISSSLGCTNHQKQGFP